MLSFLKSFQRQVLPPAFISFDVEALPFRAAKAPLDTLIWGKTSAGEYGIKRLSAILREYKLKGNFLVEMAACHLYGDAAMREVTDFLLEEGHEVHAHLHPELLADEWLFKHVGVKARSMAGMDQRMSESLLRFTATAFERLVGNRPSLFRSGSYQFNQHTVTAAKKEGYSTLSNYNSKRHFSMLPYDPIASRMEPYRWTNGIAEIPVDISSPEKTRWEEFVSQVEMTQLKPTEKTCNLVFHSWSLLRRDEKGHHGEFGPELEEQFQKICSHLAGTFRVWGYEEYLNRKLPLSEVGVEQCTVRTPAALKKAKQCPDCGAVVSAKVAKGAECPGCGGERLTII
jgi:hypothetical protein